MSDNIQKKIGRNRSPRVQITYDLETEGAFIIKELDCVIGIIADLTGTRDETDPITSYRERKFVFVDADNLDDVLKSFKPMAIVKVGLDPQKMESYPVKFQKISDFHPIFIIKSVPILNERYEKRSKLSDLLTRISNSSKLFDAASALIGGKEKDPAKAIEWYKFISEEQKAHMLEIFQLCIGLKSIDDNAILSIQDSVATLDTEINTMLNQALHTPEYQKLEGSWFGIKYLVQNAEFGESLKLRILNASMKEVGEDITRALDFDQSFLFQKLYEEEYGTFGGMPYTCLLVDHLITRMQEDFTFLHKLSEVVCSAHIPTSIGVDSQLFDLDSFTDLSKIRILAKILDSKELFALKSFKERDEARYISLVLPRFMGRIPYGKKTNPIDGLTFEEDVSTHDKFCWSNSIYSYGCKIAQSFSRFHWFASIIGVENGGMVENLPVYTYKASDGDTVIKCPTEVTITDRREKELSDKGFISLCHCKDTNYAVFFSGQSANSPPLYSKNEANANARLSARFQYMLNCSRFAHYIKCIMRDKVGNFSDKLSIERFLTEWITRYVLAMDEAPQEIKAKYPLREAKIIVEEVLARPGSYDAIIYLKPHFQMEELTVSLRLVARIPGKKEG